MYGHPTQETLDRLEQVTSKIFRTDYSGEVDIISDGKEINIIENIKIQISNSGYLFINLMYVKIMNNVRKRYNYGKAEK